MASIAFFYVVTTLRIRKLLTVPLDVKVSILWILSIMSNRKIDSRNSNTDNLSVIYTYYILYKYYQLPQISQSFTCLKVIFLYHDVLKRFKEKSVA